MRPCAAAAAVRLNAAIGIDRFIPGGDMMIFGPGMFAYMGGPGEVFILPSNSR
jgi:hypothetical protein